MGLGVCGIRSRLDGTHLQAGKTDVNLQAQGLRISLGDLLIGTTALELGYAVVTHNVRHFKMIPDLVVKQI